MFLETGKCNWTPSIPVQARATFDVMETKSEAWQSEGILDWTSPPHHDGGHDCMAFQWLNAHPCQEQPDPSVSSREELTAIMEGTAIYRTPVTVENLMKAFQGRYYKDVAGNVPSDDLQRQDLGPSQVLQEPAPRGTDSWTLVEENGTRFLVRKHVLPRLALFNPLRSTNCPVSLDELTGNRITTVQNVAGGEPATIKDTVDIQRNLQDRWTGETRFELLPQPGPAPKRLRVPAPKGEKRKAEDEKPAAEEEEEIEDHPGDPQDEPARGSADPPSTLTRALHSRGPDVLDGTPMKSTSGANRCAAPGCTLPGGHQGLHKDGQEREFIYDAKENQQMQVNDPEEDPAIPSSSSTTSEELLPDDDDGQPDERDGNNEKEDDVTVGCDEQDYNWLAKHRRKGAVWLSPKDAWYLLHVQK